MGATLASRRHIGIYDLQTHDIGAGGNVKESLALAEHLSQHYQVTLMVQMPIDWRYLQNYFQVDLSRVRTLILPIKQEGFLPRTSIVVVPAQASIAHHRQQIQALGLDLFINKTYASRFGSPVARGIYTCMFPFPLARVEKPQPLTSPAAWVRSLRKAYAQRKTTQAALASYSRITANSSFTQGWIRRYWGHDATVVYSACELVGTEGPKEKWIVNVGRFSDHESKGGHHKRQDLMIDAFKQLTDLHAAGWQLHLVGSAGQDDPSKAYTNRLQAAAAGFPIVFHFNAEQEALHTLYRRAALYWHATGHGAAAQKHPATQEHFGITTVEAMSAGAVPVVINSGGQQETVQHGITGMLWDTVKELLTHTRHLANAPEQWQALSVRAVAASAHFGKTAHLDRMDRIIEDVMTNRHG